MTLRLRSGQAWAKEIPPFAEWDVHHTATSTIRITEDGRRRIIENGSALRIIERFDSRWNIETPPYNIWIKE